MVDPPGGGTGTTPERRHRRAAITFAIVVAAGVAAMVALVARVHFLAGLSTFVRLQIWLVPTVAVPRLDHGRPERRRVDRPQRHPQTWPGFASGTASWARTNHDHCRSAS
ncbi:MAG: hypothetical protein R2697_06965 [Ilumatobacteraceae bacterium]